MTMHLDKIKTINIELKIINLDIDRIAAKMEDTNRNIKSILKNNAIEARSQELKELVEFNRFLLQKHKEKIADKRSTEDRLRSCVHEETQVENEIIEDEKRLEYFILTVEDNLAFNSDHPFYLDPAFIRDLLRERLKREDYEKCAQLKAHLDQLQESVL